MQELEQNWSEPVHEYSQFASIIKKLLVYRHQKHAQYEMTQDGLESKKEQMEELEKSEREAKRLEAALGKGRLQRRNSDPGEGPRPETEGQDESGRQQESSMSAILPPHPGPSTIRRRAPGMGFLSALSYTLHGMMDADPETARRNSISRNRELISQVSEHDICGGPVALLIPVYSWKMLFIWPHRISNIRVPQFKLTLIGSNDKRSLTSEKCASVWPGATEIGAKRLVSESVTLPIDGINER
jgi:hypothetical protein